MQLSSVGTDPRLTFGDMTKEVNVFNLDKQPRNIEDQLFEVNLIENMTSKHREELELEAECEIEFESEDFNLDAIVNSAVNWASSQISPSLDPTNLTPPIESSTSLELKALPKHLKYVYLGEQKTLLVITASHLTVGQEKSLVSVLKKYRKAISWTMTDIKGLSPAIVQHRIHLHKEVTSKRDLQRRLNPITKEVVLTEILKLLDNRINSE